MKKIAFHIQKGGVGKTSLSGNIAKFLAIKNKKVVLVDCDIYQGSSSSWFFKENQNIDYDIKDIIMGKVEIGSVVQKIDANFYVIPCIPSDAEMRFGILTKLQIFPFVVEDLCSELEKLNFDFAIFDLSPSFTLWEEKCVLAMDEVITPLTPEYFSLEGIEIFQKELIRLNKNNRKNIKHNKIVCNLFHKGYKRHRKFLEYYEQLNFDIYKVGIDSKIAESQVLKKSIFDYYPDSKAIPELSRLGYDLCL